MPQGSSAVRLTNGLYLLPSRVLTQYLNQLRHGLLPLNIYWLQIFAFDYKS